MQHEAGSKQSYIRAATTSHRVTDLEDRNRSFAERLENPHIQRSLVPEAEGTHLVIYINSKHFNLMIKEFSLQGALKCT
jgi:hypothetical protein